MSSNQLKQFVPFVFVWIYILLKRVFRQIADSWHQKQYFYSHLLNFSPNISMHSLSESEQIAQYHQQMLQRFLTFSKLPPSNDNTPRILYDENSYKLLDADHAVTQLFKSRILFENSPLHNHNIILFYDPVQLSFSYYSDFYISSYPLLNAVAMKYCCVFWTRDLFVDENIITSPLLQILKEYYYPDNMLEPTIVPKLDLDFEFIKQNANLFKVNKNKSTSSVKPTLSTMKEEKYYNKFTYLGRIRDFHPLQPNKTPFQNTNSYSLIFPEFISTQEMFQKDTQFDWMKFKSRNTKLVF